jgi:hypothetical protein
MLPRIAPGCAVPESGTTCATTASTVP